MKKVNYSFVAIVILLLTIYFYSNLKQKYESRKISNTNLHRSFEEALDCQCDQGIVVSPYLKVLGLIQNENSEEQKQKWLLETEKGISVLFENETKNCSAFNFKKYDLVRIRGEIIYLDSGPVIRSAYFRSVGNSQNGYVEYLGKRYCEKP